MGCSHFKCLPIVYFFTFFPAQFCHFSDTDFVISHQWLTNFVQLFFTFFFFLFFLRLEVVLCVKERFVCFLNDFVIFCFV